MHLAISNHPIFSPFLYLVRHYVFTTSSFIRRHDCHAYGQFTLSPSVNFISYFLKIIYIYFQYIKESKILSTCNLQLYSIQDKSEQIYDDNASGFAEVCHVICQRPKKSNDAKPITVTNHRGPAACAIFSRLILSKYRYLYLTFIYLPPYIILDVYFLYFVFLFIFF